MKFQNQNPHPVKMCGLWIEIHIDQRHLSIKQKEKDKDEEGE